MINDLPNGTLIFIFQTLGIDSQISVLNVCKKFATLISQVIDYYQPCKLCIIAAKNNHFELLKWLRSKPYNWMREEYNWDHDVCTITAENGNLEMLKWVVENGCPWDDEVCYHAAKSGHLHIIEWAKSNRYNGWNYKVLDGAAEGGHLRILEWAKNNNCQWDSIVWSHDMAVHNGHFDVVKWMKDRGYSIRQIDRNDGYVFEWSHNIVQI